MTFVGVTGTDGCMICWSGMGSAASARIVQTLRVAETAKRCVWIPFIEALGADEDTLPVGHSSGAMAALRYAETHKLRAMVLVSATFTDLGDAGERTSGYYPQGDPNPYLFDAMKTNCSEIHQFHSDNDPFIPVAEAERIRAGPGLSDTYYLLRGRSHFFEPFPCRASRATFRYYYA